MMSYYEEVRKKVTEKLRDKLSNYELGLSALENNDLEQAVAYFKTASEPLDSEEKYNWGVMYYRGDGVEKNIDKALKWIGIAADEGYPVAEKIMGMFYFEGKLFAIDEEKAIRYFIKSYEHGQRDSYIYYMLGQSYLYGEFVNTDVNKGIEYITDAAQLHDNQCEIDAQVLLCNIYYKGEFCERNLDVAEKWAQKAIDSGRAEVVELLEQIKREKIEQK